MSHFHLYYNQDQFINAVKDNDFQKIERLLEQHTDVIVCRRAAEEAVERGAVECLTLLLPHCGNFTFDECITSAVVRMQPEVVRALVAHYPPSTLDVNRIEQAFDKQICEESLSLVLPYMSAPERFSLILNIAAPMSEGLVRACIDGIDPLHGNSVMLAWGAVYNDARFDVLYPISDPTQALVMLINIRSALGAGAKHDVAQAAQRIEARMQRTVLEEHVGATACEKTRMKI